MHATRQAAIDSISLLILTEGLDMWRYFYQTSAPVGCDIFVKFRTWQE